ncbi:MAG: Arc family DNA-binding protein [Ectothiorhodospiraceae bacterium]|nr:Arc family DNA-binding protein [Ectothiorhodospiraceae bacterium]
MKEPILRIQLRIPESTAKWIKTKAEKSFRSMNSEIVVQIMKAQREEQAQATQEGQ